MILPNEHTLYAGIDLHKTYSYVTIMNVLGHIQYHGRFENQERTLIPHLLSYNQPVEATVEASYGWYWLADDLDHAHIPLDLAHPAKINAIAGAKKTDKEDSKALANLLRTNLLPRAYIPSQDERSMKEILRFRLSLVEHRSSLKRRLHDILAKQNLQCPYADILGKKSRAWIEEQHCPFPYGEEITSSFLLCDQLDAQIETITKQATEIIPGDPSITLLRTIPGIGSILAMTLVSEIGDIHRFANDRALAAYAGVVPSVHASGDKTHLGPTGHRGNSYIRWALAEAIGHLTQDGDPFVEAYEKLKAKKGAGTARVAMMNKLIRIIFAMLTKGKPFLPPTTTIPSSSKVN